MGATPRYGLRFPANIAPSAIWSYFQNLAEDVEGRLAALDDRGMKPWPAAVTGNPNSFEATPPSAYPEGTSVGYGILPAQTGTGNLPRGGQATTLKAGSQVTQTWVGAEVPFFLAIRGKAVSSDAWTPWRFL